ncbi:MAG: hypothetical protein QM756_37565 [Polyangiaceae bacterium]
MRKLLLMSIFLLPIFLGVRLSRGPRPQRNLKRTVVITVLFYVAWAILGSRLFFKFSGSQ